jgi:uncharacterized protein (DUF885 family)
MQRVFLSCAVLAALVAAGIAGARPPIAAVPSAASPAADSAWNSLVDQFFDNVYYKFGPSQGTVDGFHQYDNQLEDYSRAEIERQAAALHEYEKRFENFDVKGLSPVEAADRELVLGHIRSSLLDLETIKWWQKDPDLYSSGVTQSIFPIMSRKFAPPDDRLKSVIAREKNMPTVFAAARENLRNPPQIYTEIALEQLPGIVSFFQNDVPSAFTDAKDPAVKAEFEKSNAAVVAALQQYSAWVKSDLLPRSHGDFRLGAEVYSKKLLYDEMVDTPLDRLLEIDRADMRRNQAEFARVAHELDPSKTPQQVLAEMDANYPKPDQLLAVFRNTFDGLISFIQQKHIITIPSDVRPIVEDTPPFMRATTFASIFPPGPYERVAKEAYFNVTVPDPSESPEEIAGFMGGLNWALVRGIAIHEAYPGHYVQFLWVQQAPTKVRKLFGAASNSEGWAHYCEQMMLDEGFNQPGVGAKDERDAKLMRLGQLQDALLRNARFVVGIEMHRGTMSFDQAVDFFVKEGYQTHQAGLVETKRGTSDPTYLYYTLGKLEILKLRADLQRKEGAAFSLQKFHDDFMRQGFPPIKIVRKALLGDDSPPL